MIFTWFMVLTAAAVMLGSRAVANGYLLVIRSRRHGLVLMEHGADEKYHLFAAYMLPLVLLRYALLHAAYSLLVLRERAYNFRPIRKAMALPAKA